MANSGYIYLGQYYHKNGLNLQELGVTEKKVGKTINLAQREYGLNSTKMTIGYTIVAAFEVDDMEKVEKSIHYLLEHNRLDGEWFTDEDNTLINRVRKFMLLQGHQEVLLEDDVKEDIIARRTRSQVQNSKTISIEEVMVNGIKIAGRSDSELQFNILNELINNQKIDALSIARDIYPEDKSGYVNGGQVLFQECNSPTYNGENPRYRDQRKWITEEWGTISNGAGNLEKLFNLKIAEVKPILATQE